MALNFPMGKIFLGDGGAYALVLLVWSSIILIKNASEVSAFAILLAVFLASGGHRFGYMRLMKLGNPADRPDRLHFRSFPQCAFLKFGFLVVTEEKFPIHCTLMLIQFISAPKSLGSCFGTTLK